MGCGCHSKPAQVTAPEKQKVAEPPKPAQQPAKSVRRDGTQKRPGLGAIAPQNDGSSSDTRCACIQGPRRAIESVAGPWTASKL